MKTVINLLHAHITYILTFIVVIVPQFDARTLTHTKNMYDDIIKLMKIGKLPKYSDEIPPDAVVIVGHTVNIYEGSSTGLTLSFNIQWVIILSTPA